MRTNNGRWHPVTKDSPCPVCGHVDWCAWTPDGERLRCMRDGTAPKGMCLATIDTSGGKIYCQVDASRAGSARQHMKHPAPNHYMPRLDDLDNQFRTALAAERRDELATMLGVTATSLCDVGVGWATASDLKTIGASGAGWPENWPDGAFTFGERDGDGHLVGFSLRAIDGRKGSPSSKIGARRGLVVPASIRDNGEPILIVEGPSDVAACCVLGVFAVGRPSNTAGSEQLTKLLRNRCVLVVGENDAKLSGAWPGRDGAERIATQLAANWGDLVLWGLTPDNAKDVREWLTNRVANGLDLADRDACLAAGRSLVAALQAVACEVKPEKAPSVAEQLVRIALESYRIGQSEKNELFAVAHSGPNLAVMLDGSSRNLKAKLAKEYRLATGRTPDSSALADAVTVLTGEALDAQPEPVGLRLALHEGQIVIDLGDDEGRAVIVRADGWHLVERSPVLFRRTALTGKLPIPEQGGVLDELRDLLNVTDESWPLIVGWLIASLLPDIPHAIFLLSGLQGTGKSSAARVLVSLIDPSPAPLRSEPRDMEQWQLGASGSWIVCLDNLSGIPPWLADALCRAATGDGLVKRKLYTDSELTVLSFRRVILLTSIDPGALRGDLGERLLLGDLEPIPEAERRTEQELDAMFAERRPRLFGAILAAVARVLDKLPDVRPGRMPRMADFGRVLAAADAAGVTNGALGGFLGQQGRIADDVIDADPFGAAIDDLIRSLEGDWIGTATQLLAELLPNAGDKVPIGWPKRNGVKGRLKRLIPAFEKRGISVEWAREPTAQRNRLIRLSVVKTAAEIVQNVQAVQSADLERSILDDLGDVCPPHPLTAEWNVG